MAEVIGHNPDEEQEYTNLSLEDLEGVLTDEEIGPYLMAIRDNSFEDGNEAHD